MVENRGPPRGHVLASAGRRVTGEEHRGHGVRSTPREERRRRRKVTAKHLSLTAHCVLGPLRGETPSRQGSRLASSPDPAHLEPNLSAPQFSPLPGLIPTPSQCPPRRKLMENLPT